MIHFGVYVNLHDFIKLCFDTEAISPTVTPRFSQALKIVH